MSIQNLTEAEFVHTLNSHLSPSSPINQVTLLRGRVEQIEQIRRAFHSPGRQVFIHGDRGVGKSSLAIAVGNYLCPEDRSPIQVACNNQGFYSLIRDIANQLLSFIPIGPAKTSKRTLGFQKFGISAALEVQLQERSVPTLTSINEAVSVLRYCGDRGIGEAVVILDEFDKISGPEDREMFADLIKQLGDQRVPIKFFFTGIGTSLEELLADHHSCYRYIEAVHLQPLDWDGRLEIIRGAAEALGLEVDKTSEFRIGAMSDGFPHYVHLVCEKLFWGAFDADEPITMTNASLYIQAVKEAVKGIEPTLKRLYEEATHKYNNDYQEGIWAVADHHEFKRRSSDIYISYCDIMKQRAERKPLDRAKFNQRMNAMKQMSHGEMLQASRTGWYEFREPILRGYIRLRAEMEGVQLAQEHPGQVGARRISLFHNAKLVS